MGAGASLDASSVLTKEEAKAIAGDQWDEAKWEAAEKDEAGAVRAELLIAHIAAATVARPDEFSGLGEEARKRAAKTRAKELKAEISKWSEDFEENQGRKPSEEDKVAIKDKVDLFKHYKAMYQAKAPHGDDSKQPAAKVSSVKPSDDESSPRPARADAGAASARALTSPHAIQASPDASMMEVREEINADADAPDVPDVASLRAAVAHRVQAASFCTIFTMLAVFQTLAMIFFGAAEENIIKLEKELEKVEVTEEDFTAWVAIVEKALPARRPAFSGVLGGHSGLPSGQKI